MNLLVWACVNCCHGELLLLCLNADSFLRILKRIAVIHKCDDLLPHCKGSLQSHPVMQRWRKVWPPCDGTTSMIWVLISWTRILYIKTPYFTLQPLKRNISTVNYRCTVDVVSGGTRWLEWWSESWRQVSILTAAYKAWINYFRVCVWVWETERESEYLWARVTSVSAVLRGASLAYPSDLKNACLLHSAQSHGFLQKAHVLSFTTHTRMHTLTHTCIHMLWVSRTLQGQQAWPSAAGHSVSGLTCVCHIER